MGGAVKHLGGTVAPATTGCVPQNPLPRTRHCPVRRAPIRPLESRLPTVFHCLGPSAKWRFAHAVRTFVTANLPIADAASLLFHPVPDCCRRPGSTPASATPPRSIGTKPAVAKRSEVPGHARGIVPLLAGREHPLLPVSARWSPDALAAPCERPPGEILPPIGPPAASSVSNFRLTRTPRNASLRPTVNASTHIQSGRT